MENKDLIKSTLQMCEKLEKLHDSVVRELAELGEMISDQLANDIIHWKSKKRLFLLMREKLEFKFGGGTDEEPITKDERVVDLDVARLTECDHLMQVLRTTMEKKRSIENTLAEKQKKIQKCMTETTQLTLKFCASQQQETSNPEEN